MMFRRWACIALLFICGTCTAQESRTFFVTDAAGSPILGTDSYANVKWTEDYLPFGERRLRNVSSGSNERWFTWAPQNEDTGLVDLGYRTYDPATGRFLSLDPAGAKPENIFTHNLYVYGNNNPYRYIDPDGRNVFSLLDWKDFAHDVGGLLVSEIVYVSATVMGDTATANAAIEGMVERRFDAAASTAGIVSPVPRTGNVIKAARHADEVGAAIQGVSKAARGVAGKLKGLGNIGSHGVVDAGIALSSAQKWLGSGYKEIAPGVFRSSDGLRQFRMTNADLLPTHGKIGSHVHFEALDDIGEVIENLHLPVGP